MALTIKKLDDRCSQKLNSQYYINSFGRVVKELLENSIDAKASKVEIRLDLQSLSVFVKDNGFGMDLENLKSTGRRYFTSKLDDLEHLGKIDTFGFRGEALQSIEAISKLTVISKHKSEETYQLSLKDGYREISIYSFDNKLESDHFYSVPFQNSGTIVIARNIFEKLPVRQSKLLNQPVYKLLDEIREYLVLILVKFKDIDIDIFIIDHEQRRLHPWLIIDKKQIAFNKSIEESYASVLRTVFGSSALGNYESIYATISDYTLLGILSLRPYQSKKHQYIFINERLFLVSEEDSNEINKIFEISGYEMEAPQFHSPKSNLSPKKSSRKSPMKASSVGKPYLKFPIFIINIKCPVEIEDLIQDASKCIHKSMHWESIKGMIFEVFKKFLITKGYNSSPSALKTFSPRKRKMNVTPVNFSPSRNDSNDLQNLQPSKTFDSYNYDLVIRNCSEEMDKSKYFNNLNEFQLSKSDIQDRNYRIIKQLDNKFILILLTVKKVNKKLKDPTLFVIDQHACDERIRVEALFEEFISQLMDSNKMVKVSLKSCFDIPISSNESSMFQEFKSNFNFFGIDFALKKNILIVSHLPQILIEKVQLDLNFLKYCLLQHLYDIKNHSKSLKVNVNNSDWFSSMVNLPRIIIDIINTKACRSSIKFGEELTFPEMEYMIRCLGQCKLPFQCAHGRPTIVPLANLGELEFTNKKRHIENG